MTLICPECRCENDPKRIYCHDCGARLDRSVLARALANIDGMGAKSIGVDILIDQPQLEDQQLMSTLKGMRTPLRLAYDGVQEMPVVLAGKARGKLAQGIHVREAGGNMAKAHVTLLRALGLETPSYGFHGSETSEDFAELLV